MSRTDEIFKPALEKKKIPLLTLDHKWHQLFTQTEPDKRLKRLEEELNELLKRQGKANTEIREIRKLKKRLMQGIMENAVEASVENDQMARKRADESSRLIAECNEKIQAYKEELLELPEKIEKVNYQLMLTTMEICYSRLKENEKEIEETARWAARVRVELKKRLVRSQEKKMMNQELYSYMHDIFGADVIEIFDMKYQMKDIEKAENKDAAQGKEE